MSVLLGAFASVAFFLMHPATGNENYGNADLDRFAAACRQPDASSPYCNIATMTRGEAVRNLKLVVTKIGVELSIARYLEELSTRLVVTDKPMPRMLRYGNLYEVWLNAVDPLMNERSTKLYTESFPVRFCKNQCPDAEAMMRSYGDILDRSESNVLALIKFIGESSDTSWNTVRARKDLISRAFGGDESNLVVASYFHDDRFPPPPPAPPPPPFSQSPIHGPGEYRVAATVDFPAVALILQQSSLTTSYDPTCTGALVSTWAVLTAAHCVCGVHRSSETCRSRWTTDQSLAPSRFKAFFQGVGVRTVRAISIHPQYRSVFQDGLSSSRLPIADLALLVLANPVAEIHPFLLSPNAGQIPRSTPDLMIGMGFHRPLVKDAINIVTMPPAAKLHNFVVAGGCNRGGLSILCAKNAALGEGNGLLEEESAELSYALSGFCQGDSGGPLLRNSGTHATWKNWNNYVLVGLAESQSVSASGACESGQALVFTNLQTFRTWIDDELARSRPANPRQLANALQPIYNPDRRFFGMEERAGFERGLRTQDFQFGIPADARAHSVTLTLNASCTGDFAAGTCVGSGLTVHVTNPQGIDVAGCALTISTTVYQCRLTPSQSGWAGGVYKVRVEGFVPVTNAVPKRAIQDIQFAAIGF